MTRLIFIAAAVAVLAACSPLRDRPYDDANPRARARPTPDAAAFMGYHGPQERSGEVPDKQ
jgi:uncharacterized lipoprotein